MTVNFSRPWPPRWNVMGAPRGATGPAGCSYALYLVLSYRRPLDADLPDDAGLDTRVSDANGDVPDNLVGHVLHGQLVHVGRMVELHVPARAHDDVQTGGVGHAGHGHRVSPDADAGEFDQCPASEISELHGFIYRRLLVCQEPVVPDWLAGPDQVQLIHGQLLLPQVPVRGRSVVVRLVCPGSGDKQVLVHQGDPQLVRVYGTPDRHHLASHVRCVCSHGCLLPRSTHVTMATMVGDKGGESKGGEGGRNLSHANRHNPLRHSGESRNPGWWWWSVRKSRLPN